MFTSSVIELDPSLQIDQTVAMLATFTLVMSIVAFMWPLKSTPELLPLISQTLLWITVVTAILTTGGLTSPLLALWIPAVIFTGLFGVNGLLPAITASLGYLVWLYSSDSLDMSASVTVILTGILPVILGYVIFSQLTKGEDSSSYKRLASELSEASSTSDVVINAITNGVIALNKQGIIELINPAAQRILGWDKHDALNLNYKSILKMTDKDGNDFSSVADPVAKALQNNRESRTDDIVMTTKSGKKLQVSLVVSSVGQPGSGVIVVFRDISKEKAEEREQAEFISTASHEMRTPVASIEGYLGLALNPSTAQIDDKAREYITKAHEAAQHLGRLFQDLLDVSKAEDGRLSNNPKVVEVVGFVSGIIDGLRPKAEGKGLTVEYKPEPSGKIPEKLNRRLNPVFYANVDNDHLREVISNLLENAIKYTQQGSVSIDITGDDDEIEISVEDTGIGVPAEDISHLFQKFYRVDSSDTREIGGTGLGLYLCRRLAETMGGKVRVESQHGQGSTFTLSIPRISHQEAMQMIETAEDTTEHEIIHESAGAVLPDQPIQSPVEEEQSSDPTLSPSEGIFSTVPSSVVANQINMSRQAPPLQAQSVPISDNPSLEMIEKNPDLYLKQVTDGNMPPKNLH